MYKFIIIFFFIDKSQTKVEDQQFELALRNVLVNYIMTAIINCTLAIRKSAVCDKLTKNDDFDNAIELKKKKS